VTQAQIINELRGGARLARHEHRLRSRRPLWWLYIRPNTVTMRIEKVRMGTAESMIKHGLIKETLDGDWTLTEAHA
jgi:hypothetical protein